MAPSKALLNEPIQDFFFIKNIQAPTDNCTGGCLITTFINSSVFKIPKISSMPCQNPLRRQRGGALEGVGLPPCVRGGAETDILTFSTPFRRHLPPKCVLCLLAARHEQGLSDRTAAGGLLGSLRHRRAARPGTRPPAGFCSSG